MKIDQKENDLVTIITLSGEMGINDASRLSDHIDELINNQRLYIILDLEQVDFIGSQAICRLLRINREVLANGGMIKLLRPGTVIKRFLSMGRVIELFERFENKTDAVRSFPTTAPSDTTVPQNARNRLKETAEGQRRLLLKLIDLLASKGHMNKDEFNTEMIQSNRIVMQLFRNYIINESQHGKPESNN